MLDLSKQQVFIPEKYVLYMDMIVETDDYGRGVMVEQDKLSSLITEGRIHGNVILHRAVVYVMKESAIVPPNLATTRKIV